MQAGVIVTAYVSVHAALAQAYNHAQDWTTSARTLGDRTRSAQVSHTFVHALPCATVHISTLPATVALALAVAHVESSCQLQAMYLVHSQRSLIYAQFLPLTGDVISVSLAVSVAYQSICKALSLVFGLEFNDATIASKNAKLFDILTTESTG